MKKETRGRILEAIAYIFISFLVVLIAINGVTPLKFQQMDKYIWHVMNKYSNRYVILRYQLKYHLLDQDII